ncbi:C40 family peptidase [Paenibacillus kyungheensis]
MKRNLITLVTAAVLLTSTPQMMEAATTPVPVGKVNLPVNFRSGPTPDSTVYGTLQPGTNIKILREVNSYWLRVKVGVKTGYVSASYINYTPKPKESNPVSTSPASNTVSSQEQSSKLQTAKDTPSTPTITQASAPAPAPAPTSTPVTPIPRTNDPGTGIVERGVNFRAEPTTGSDVLRVLPVGETFKALEQPSVSWIKIKDSTGTVGYVSTDYVSYTLPASATPVLTSLPVDAIPEVDDTPFQPPVTVTPPPTLATGSPLDEATADLILGSALALQGITHYGYGKNEAPTLFDCSSFTRYVFGQAGIDLAWGTQYQKNVGIEVERGQWQKGDLLFFSGGDPNVISHVGIYAGDNKLVHNSVSLDGIAISNLDLDYWVKHYVTARRVLQ